MALPNSDQSARAVRRRERRAANRMIQRRYLIPARQQQDKVEDRIIAQRLRYARLSLPRLRELGERAVEAGILKHVEPDLGDMLSSDTSLD